ncbi:MAG TPA: hypothetical protein VFU74_04565, partial [Actinocrinis sp.]|nr:hypothetical protein [Actinocrinis sp.]
MVSEHADEASSSMPVLLMPISSMTCFDTLVTVIRGGWCQRRGWIVAIDELPLPVVNFLNVIGVEWPYID